MLTLFDTGSMSIIFKHKNGFGIILIKLFKIVLVHLFWFCSVIHGLPGLHFLILLPINFGKQEQLSAHGNGQLIALILELEPFSMFLKMV